jgi:hypothetical protein
MFSALGYVGSVKDSISVLAVISVVDKPLKFDCWHFKAQTAKSLVLARVDSGDGNHPSCPVSPYFLSFFLFFVKIGFRIMFLGSCEVFAQPI